MHVHLDFFTELLDVEVAELQKVYLYKIAQDSGMPNPSTALRRQSYATLPAEEEEKDSAAYEHEQTRDALLRLLSAMDKDNPELTRNAVPEALGWRLARLMQQSKQKQFCTSATPLILPTAP